MADYPQYPVESKDHRLLVNVVNTSVRRLNRPVMPVRTVAELTALATLDAQRGELAYATDGRKAGEGAGVGTGTLVFFDGSATWIAVDTGTAVAA